MPRGIIAVDPGALQVPLDSRHLRTAPSGAKQGRWAMRGSRGMIRIVGGWIGLASVVGTLAGRPAGKPVAAVNDVNICQEDLDAVVPPPRQRSPVPESADRHKMKQMEALTYLMDDILMQKFLALNAPKVPDAEVDKKIAEISAELTKQGKT